MKRLLPIFLLAGCNRPRAPAPVANELSPAALDYLVWVQGPDRAVTTWVAPDGHAVATTPGILISDGASLWRVTSTDVTFPLRTCDQIDHDPMPPPDGAGEDAHGNTLTATSGGATLALGDAWVDEGYAELDWQNLPSGGLGPFVFTETHVSDYGCGAHGGEDVNAAVYDLRDRKSVTDLVTRDELAPLAEAAAAALAAENDEEVDPANMQYGATRPVWKDGALSLQHLLWVETCYACGNGLWSSYTSGAWVDAQQWPHALAELPAVPAAVNRTLAGIAPESSAGISWGTPDAAWQQAFGR